MYAPLTFGNFFQKKLQLTAKVPHPPPPFSPLVKNDPVSNDPIRSFSSSSPHHGLAIESDDEQLDPERVIASNRRAMTAAEAKRQLHQKKLQAIKAHAVVEDDDDSDLEIVVPIGPMDPLSKLATATAGKKKGQTFPQEKKKARTTGTHREMTKDEHNRALRNKATEQSMKLMAHKKADFVSRGGQLTKQDKAAATKHTDVRELLAKAALASCEPGPEIQEDDDEADDESYQPPEDEETLQGSSPKRQDPTVLVQDSSTYLEQSEDEMEEDSLEDMIPAAQIRILTSSDKEDDWPRAAPGPVRRRPQLIISDEEEEEENASALVGSDDENLPPNSAVSRSTSGFSTGSTAFPKFTQRTLASSSPRTPLGELPTIDGKRRGRSFQNSFSLSPSLPLSPSQQRMTINLDTSRDSSPSKGPLLPAFGEATTGKGSDKSSSPFAFSGIFGDEDDDKSMSVPRSAKLVGGFKPADFGAISTQLFQTVCTSFLLYILFD